MKILQKVAIIFLAVGLLFPSATKIGHIFAHENHQLVCSNYSDLHLHQETFDCHVCDWRSIPLLSFELFNFHFYESSPNNEKIEIFYSFLKGHPVSTVGLRGPPVFA